MKLEFSREIFEKHSNVKFNENLACGDRVVPFGRTDERKNKRTDMMKLIVTFRNFAKISKTKEKISTFAAVLFCEEKFTEKLETKFRLFTEKLLSCENY